MKKTAVSLAAALLALLAVAYWYWPRDAHNGPGSASASAKFELVEASDRAFEGSPALALTFALPLDARTNYDKFIKVFEMPPAAGSAPTAPVEADPGTDEEDEYRGRSRPTTEPSVSTADADTATEGGKLVQGAWIVGENPRLLHFPHVKPETRYVIRVAPGLPARDGSLLPGEARYSIRTATVSPAFYFASRGMVLPAKQNGGLPVVTVNVPEVDVQFLRVKSGQLPRFLDRVITSAMKVQPRRDSGGGEEEEEEDEAYSWHDRIRTLKGAVGNDELDSLRTMTDSVYLGRFVTEQKRNKRSVTFLPVEDIKELKEPGIYVAVMSQPGRFRYDYQTTYFYVSDMGLHVRLFEKTADAFVSSLTDGKGVGGVEIEWLDEHGKILSRAETNGDGHAAIAERPKSGKIVMARKGGQLSLITLKEPALDLSEYEITGLPYKPVRLFAYSGRDLYRPGEAFDISVLARDADGRPVPGQPIQAILKRPDGKSEFTASWQPDAAFGGYYRRRIELPADAPTGSWSLELRADPADKVAATAFRFGVEEFLPERMKLDLAAPSGPLNRQRPFTVKVTGTYLYGAPAAGNRLLGVAQYERNRNPLAAILPGFEFGDVSEDDAKDRAELPETELDDSGAAEVAVELAAAVKRRSPYTVRATLSLLESGGRPVVRTIERVVWPAPLLLGVRPLFEGNTARENAPVQFEVVRADADGRLKAASALPVRLFREDRHYYWRFEDQRGWHSGFTETDELVETASVDVPAGGRGKLTLPVRYGRYRLEIQDADTRQTLKVRFYAGWSAKSDETQGIRPDRVALRLDKPGYVEGETAKLTITPPHAGEALVTVEGDRTLWIKRIAVSESGMTLNIPIDKQWQRHDLYASVIVLRPGGGGDRVTPARALGIAHIPLARADRRLAVTLDAPKKSIPDMPLRLKVRAPEAKGEKAFVTVSAVDAGILNITRYASPDPHGFFFGRLRYGADQYDIYGRLIEKMPGQRGRLRFGGDNTPKPTRSLPKKVKLVDLFSGPVALNAQGEADVTLNVPDFNGALRLMVVAAAGNRFGSHDAEVTVAAPLVAELLTPRFLTIGDSATIALDVHNLSGASQNIQVEVNAPAGLRVAQAQRSLTLQDQQKTTLRFAVEAGNAFGIVPVALTVSGGPIPIKREFAVEVMAPTPRQQLTHRYAAAPGETLELKDAELGGFLRATVLSHLIVSDRPPIDVRSAVQGLLTYPYGCAEQTTSTAYPHVYVDEEAARRFGLKPFSREQRAEMLDKAIARLSAMQAPNGGFSLWGNASEYEYWLSSYVSNFLLDAREQNFAVPQAVHQKAMDFLLRGLQEGIAGLPASTGKPVWDSNAIWNDRRYAGSGRFAVLAYGGYLLAREAKAPLATLRQLYEARATAHSGLPLIHLGIALRLMGDEQRGNTAIAEGVRKPREPGHWWGDYGSNLRDYALSYSLLIKHQIKAEGRDNLVAVIAGEMAKQPHHWYSTQEKLALFLVGRNLTTESAGQWTAEFTSGDKRQALAGAGSHVQEITAAELASGARILNTHGEKLFVELVVSGHPAKMPAPPEETFVLKREYFRPDGASLSGKTLKVGETVLVRLSVKTKARIANALVVDRIPAGLEIENLNIVQGESFNTVTIGGMNPAEVMKNPRIQHVEFRDDRFVAAAKLEGETTFFYRARVVTPGRFTVPPLYAEDMYRPQLFGVAGAGESVTVSDGRAAADK